jgi:hypothetical protein
LRFSRWWRSWYWSSGRHTTLKVETVCFYDKLIFTYKSSWQYNPEDQYRLTMYYALLNDAVSAALVM